MNSISCSKVYIFVFFLILIPVFNSGQSQNDITKSAIEEIRNNQFLLAQDIILGINKYAYNETEVIADIVRNVYNNLEQNANLILDFSKAQTKIAISLLVLQALHIEMKKNGHRNPYKLMAIVKSLQSEVLYQNVESERQRARKTINEIKLENENSVADILKSYMIKNNFQHNSDVRKLSDEIFEFDKISSEKVMTRMINESFSYVSPIQLADNIMHGCSKIEQITSALLFLFSKLIDNNDMNNPAVLRIAIYISKIKSMKDYREISKKCKYGVNMLIQKLPTCAKNLNFAAEICIRNKGKEEYLSASKMPIMSNQKRSVFTCDINKIANNGTWKAVIIDNEIYFKNQAFYKEYLYASPIDKYDSEKRNIQTTIKEGVSDKSISWSLELYGDHCYIKNDYFNEYLYAADLVNSDQNRYVFSSRLETTGKDNPDFQWKIENCGYYV